MGMELMAGGLGQAAQGMSQGLVQAPLMVRMMQREDKQDALRKQQVEAQAQQSKLAGQHSFITGASEFYKNIGDPDALKTLWNSHASDYGLPQLDNIKPIGKSQLHVVTLGPEGQQVPYSFDLATNTITPAKLPGGAQYTPEKSLEAQAKDASAATRLGMMGGEEVDPTVAAAAGVHLPSVTTKPLTAVEAAKKKLELTASLDKLDKAGEMDALLASVSPNYVPGQKLDPKTKNELTNQIQTQVFPELDRIIAGGGKATAGVGQVGNPLSGKPAGRYKVNGQVVKWDGSKVIQ
jgi:hypothetical protein